ncbi:MAG: DNA-binding response regulator [Alphaproteobacteria bacterium]|nr:MAG: DNA-binding response regulator [Alphaproteobacteria bacterium]
MTELPHILVVDDDTRLRELLRKYLTEQGFRVTVASSAADARAKLASLEFDLIVLDIMMPGESGLALTQSLRETSRVPILLLTAMGEAEDRIAGLEQGADDYLPKPFEPRELSLRIRTILRRAAPEAVVTARELQLGPFSFDMERRILKRSGAEVHLTEAEAALLLALAQSPGTVMSRDELSRQTGNDVNSRTVDVQVTRLRRKIESDPRFPRYLQTVRGLGYVLRPD